MRKPIQIAALRYEVPSDVEGRLASFESEVIALCDDGTMWTFLSSADEWFPLPRIPQYQIRGDWLDDVREKLSESHSPERVNALLDEHDSALISLYSDGVTPASAADVIAGK